MSARLELCKQLLPDPDAFGRSWPYAVHYTDFHGRRCMPPDRNLPYEAAVARARWLAGLPGVVEVHVSLDTCG